MNGYNPNEEHTLDEFLDDGNERQSQLNRQPHNPYHTTVYAPGYAPGYAQPQKKKNTAIIALLFVALVVGIAIMAIQLFQPLDNKNNNMPNVNDNGNFYQQDPGNGGPYVYKNGPGNGGGNGDGSEYYYDPGYGGQDGGGPQFHQGPDDGQPHVWGPGPADGKGDMILSRRNEDGKTEYSTDGGKTWSETPPEGFNGQ